MENVYDKSNSKGCVQRDVDKKKCRPSLRIAQRSIAKAKYSSQLLSKSSQLPPNLYNTSKIPYENKKGSGGAYWYKSRSHYRPNVRQPPAKYYSLPKLSEKICSPCHRTKGVFLTNARDRRPTSRCMISDVGTCHENSSEPATYNPTHKKNNLMKNLNVPNPHLFHRLSIVAVKKNSIHTPHTSFTAAPGRYETRYVNSCPCSSKLAYQPTIDLLIDKEKRKKFRRLLYEKVKAPNYNSPDWRHVKGQGYRHLFMGAKPSKNKPLIEQESTKPKNVQLYPDSKYIGMINNPVRMPLSLRSSPVLNLMPRIKFNCTAKKVARKQLRSNKKIAFNSGQERFQDSYRTPVLTQKHQEKLKNFLPLERQFRDHPIMNIHPSDIKSKLDQTPKHMLPNYVPKLRKIIFKFQPLPQAKVLVTRSDTNIKEISKEGFYFTLLEAKTFFKENAKF